MNFTVIDYRENEGYLSKQEKMQDLAKRIEQEYKGKVKASVKPTMKSFIIDITPIGFALTMHEFLSFIEKTYAVVNGVYSEKVGENSCANMLFEAAMHSLITTAGQGAAKHNASALLAALARHPNIDLTAGGDYRIIHFYILDNNGLCIETIKRKEQEKLEIYPCIPQDFNWATGFIRLERQA